MRSWLSCFFISLVAVLTGQETGKVDTLKSDEIFPNSILEGYEIPTVHVQASKPDLFTFLPGSVSTLKGKKLVTLQALSGNEVFRTFSGLHITEEEGAGLRMNLGIRGLDPDRSSRVLVLEDGIPVALNPYGEPQMYYTPVIERMEGVEVLKGAGQILFGPQTIGGVVNFITANPPEKLEGKALVRVGEGGLFSSMVEIGDGKKGKGGYIFNYLRRQADDLGPTFFRQHDLNGKVKLNLSSRTDVLIKLGYFEEFSNSTYLGLTQALFETRAFDYTHLAPDDRLQVRRSSASIQLQHQWNPSWKSQFQAFGYTTTRDWQRQDFSDTPKPNATRVWGEPDWESGSLYMLDKNGHRDRQFLVGGFAANLSGYYSLGGKLQQVQAGWRMLREKAFEQRVNGTKKDARSGQLISDEERSGLAFSAFVQNKWQLSSRLSITTGIRFENYLFERDIFRINSLDTSLANQSRSNQLIPGIGVNYQPGESWTIFGGLHRGYAPPRVKDAISNSGSVYPLDPELSWNSEIGFRGRPTDRFHFELTAFHMDFSNQIIPVSESSGGTGAGLVNGGRSRHRGLETQIQAVLWRDWPKKGYEAEIWGSFTYVEAKYSADRFLESDGFLTNIRGNRIPYAPELFSSASLLVSTPLKVDARLTIQHTGDQFTDEWNTMDPTANGRAGWLESYTLMDATLQYTSKILKTTFALSCKNITDRRYIATRRPQGIRVGLPRYFSGSVNIDF